MKNIILLVIVALGLWWWQYGAVDEQQKSHAQEQIVESFKSIRNNLTGAPSTSSPVLGAIPVQQAQNENLDKVQVYGEGKVIKTLPDDNKGIRHQRFILKTDNGTLLVVHNIDLAPRLDGLQRGDKVGFTGEYISNERGGLIHWTHHDPAHRHADGWLLYQGRRYQ
ncbi:DUF3465 domain-containing protein [Snodgrassella gandavensis]|uniref:DUF3465 domain-containing protein n=1 Tax=Snodgrassella gandavensis TaxID=2946698 RepID=UPI001EF503AB|nr:DUF3465 domain-containing protein [Snodgrassella gandavensis]